LELFPNKAEIGIWNKARNNLSSVLNPKYGMVQQKADRGRRIAWV
jgi:hypothetical protein